MNENNIIKQDGLRILTPDKGYKLLIDGDLKNFVYMGINSKVEDFIQVKDADYVEIKEDEVKTLNELKLNTIKQSKINLAKYISNNPLYSEAHNKNGGYYNVDEDHQNRLDRNISSYNLAVSSGNQAILTWNETGENCEVWTLEEAIQLALEMRNYVAPLISMQQHLEKEIVRCETDKDVLNIDISFNQQSIDLYKKSFIEMIEKSLGGNDNE